MAKQDGTSMTGVIRQAVVAHLARPGELDSLREQLAAVKEEQAQLLLDTGEELTFLRDCIVTSAHQGDVKGLIKMRVEQLQRQGRTTVWTPLN
jgi:hypothetical protein